MAVVHVVVNSLQWVVVRAAMLEKQLELHLVNNIDCVQAVQAAALKVVKVPQVFLALLLIPEQVHTQSVYAPVEDLVATALVSMLYLAVIIALQ